MFATLLSVRTQTHGTMLHKRTARCVLSLKQGIGAMADLSPQQSPTSAEPEFQTDRDRLGGKLVYRSGAGAREVMVAEMIDAKSWQGTWRRLAKWSRLAMPVAQLHMPSATALT